MAERTDSGHWPLVLQGVVVVVLISGGVWSLISAPLNKDIAALDARTDRIDETLGTMQSDVRKMEGRLDQITSEMAARTRALERLADETERRRQEFATKAEVLESRLASLANVTAEIKRLDQLLDHFSKSALTADTFNAWKQERDGLIASIQQRISQIERDSVMHERLDRQNDEQRRRQ